MLEFKPTSQRGCDADCTATGMNRNGKEAVTGTVSEAFARWLRHRYARRTAVVISHDIKLIVISCLAAIFLLPTRQRPLYSTHDEMRAVFLLHVTLFLCQ